MLKSVLKKTRNVCSVTPVAYFQTACYVPATLLAIQHQSSLDWLGHEDIFDVGV